MYELSGVDMGAPNIVSAGFRGNDSELVLGNKEASGGVYGLSIEDVSDTGRARFTHGGITIGRGDTHVIDVGTWQEQGYVTVGVDKGSDGTIDEERKLQDSASGIIQLPVILKSSSNQPPPTNLALNLPAFPP